jgi:hypothetical protein
MKTVLLMVLTAFTGLALAGVGKTHKDRDLLFGSNKVACEAKFTGAEGDILRMRILYAGKISDAVLNVSAIAVTENAIAYSVDGDYGGKPGVFLHVCGAAQPITLVAPWTRRKSVGFVDGFRLTEVCPDYVAFGHASDSLSTRPEKYVAMKRSISKIRGQSNCYPAGLPQSWVDGFEGRPK